jgi:hypothetical protein
MKRVVELAAVLVAIAPSARALEAAEYVVTPPPRQTPWAIVLCTPSDLTAVDPQHDYDFYNRLFTIAGQGTGNLTDYWSALSYGNVDLSGSRVFGWYDLGKTAAQLQAEGRDAHISDCINAAAHDTDLATYYNAIAVYNFGLGDSGAE